MLRRGGIQEYISGNAFAWNGCGGAMVCNVQETNYAASSQIFSSRHHNDGPTELLGYTTTGSFSQARGSLHPLMCLSYDAEFVKMQKANERTKAYVTIMSELRKSVYRLLDKYDTSAVVSAVSQVVHCDFGIRPDKNHDNPIPSSPVPPRLRVSGPESATGV